MDGYPCGDVRFRGPPSACRQIEKEEETHGRQDMALQAQSADAEIATQAQAEKADGEGTDLIPLS